MREFWRLTAAILSLGLTVTSPLAKVPETESCRQFSAAILKGDVNAAVDAVNPEPSDRPQWRENATRVIGAIAGALKHKASYLERTLSDRIVENHPTSLQIWSFGDTEVYFVGCLTHGEGRDMRFAFEIRSSGDEVVQKLKATLTGR